MSTIWKALCLSHEPAIVVDLPGVDGGHEARSEEIAHAVLDQVREQHPHCDLVLGGYSYPLVRGVCLGGGSSCMHSGGPRSFDPEALRLALAAWLIPPSDDPLVKQLSQARDKWFNRNRCWTRERLIALRFELGVDVPALSR